MVKSPSFTNTCARSAPFSVVWTTLPLISHMLPFVGHLGITDSQGFIHDFSGPFTITTGNMMCGPPIRFWSFIDISKHIGSNKKLLEDYESLQHLVPTSFQRKWDEAIAAADREYKGRMHNLFCDNCYSHVAFALNHVAQDLSSVGPDGDDDDDADHDNDDDHENQGNATDSVNAHCGIVHRVLSRNEHRWNMVNLAWTIIVKGQTCGSFLSSWMRWIMPALICYLLLALMIYSLI